MKSEVSISGNRVHITRVINAPRQLVFGWWSQAEKLQQWSGCKDAVRCEVQMDFRVGGSFTQKMQIGNGCEFTLTGVYEQIVEPEKIVYQANLGPAVTRVTVEFQEHGKGTRIMLTHEGLPDATVCNAIAHGTDESLEKLEAVLAPLTAGAS